MKFNLGKIVNVKQGSPEWLALRAKRFTASEAPASQGKSKYLSRNDLLKQKSTGIVPDVDSHQQRIFDDGHRAEAATRPIAEAKIDDELFPVVLDDAEGGFLASMDGLTMCRTIGWEHKWLSAELAKQIDAGQLDEHYMIQLDQQFALSGAKRILFTASDGTEENCKHLWVERDESRFKAVEAGWEQFAKDLAEYEAPEAEQPKAEGKAPDALPALSVQVQGMVTASNLKAFEESARATLANIKTDLQTDEDFATAEKTVKFCGEVEKRLTAAKENVLGQMQTVDEVVRSLDRIHEDFRQMRLRLNKDVTAQKEQRKLEILNAAKDALNNCIGDLVASVKQCMPPIHADFAGVMKGKKTIKSLQSACDDELARAKIEIHETANRIQGNLRQVDEHAADYRFLFSDLSQIANKPAEDFAAIVKSRIADHKEAEQKKLDAERERIRIEEEAKAKAKAESASKAVDDANRQESEQHVAAQGGEKAGKKPAFEMPPLNFADTKGATITGSIESDQVTISAKEYERLVEDSNLLNALRAAGVDNWEGWDVAIEMLQEAA